MANERATGHAFTMIKPDHIDLTLEIFDRLDGHGMRIAWNMVMDVPLGVIQEHYAVHRGKPFFDYMTKAYEGRKVAIALYSGDDIIRRFRALIGPTDPAKAGPETIRGMYSDDSLDIAVSEGRPVRNVIHCSDSPEEAQREIQVWAKYLNLMK